VITWPALREQLQLLPGYLSAHLRLTLLALLLGVLLSVPLGIWASRVRRLESAVLGAASVMQTIPSLALLAILVPLLSALGLVGIGFLPALIGLFLYSLLPVLRNTVTAIRGIDPAFIEAARGVGMTPWQQLLRVELPLAAPVIVAGVRTAAVWTVGTATLATPVGAESLGNYIFGGLQTRNFAAVLVGCVASAGLALLLDGLVRAIGIALLRHGSGGRRLLGVGVGGLLGLAVLAVAPRISDLAHGTPDRPLIIGAKTFTEQYILGRILLGQIVRSAPQPGRVLDSLGSNVAFEALRRGEIDAYVDYTGTIWSAILRRGEAPPDRSQILALTRAALRDQYGIEVLAVLGFENAYALAMREEDAARAGIASLTDLASRGRALRLGSDYEFLQRPEWAALQRRYGLSVAQQRSMDPSLMYEAMRLGEVDLISAFSSDGRIASYGLRVLRDDRGALLPYDALVLGRPGLPRERPEAAAALRRLSGAIGPALMQRLNAAVDQQRKSPQEVADLFFRERDVARQEPEARR
jgi:osmoprotectant transport system permease protein